MKPDIKIDKKIPLPMPHSKGEGYKYAFATMKIGDSFWVPDDLHTRSPQSSAYAYKRKHEGWNYTSRREMQDGVRGIRIWRTA